MNLLSNALKFSKVNGTVHVKLKLANVAPPDNIELLIEVTDSGIGISEHDLPTIFTPYFKTTDPRSLY
jgi:signal transduction histidine kinase